MQPPVAAQLVLSGRQLHPLQMLFEARPRDAGIRPHDLGVSELVSLADYGSLEAIGNLEFDESLLPPWPILGDDDDGDPLEIPSPVDTPFPVDPFD